jgi:hypothetical protein
MAGQRFLSVGSRQLLKKQSPANKEHGGACQWSGRPMSRSSERSGTQELKQGEGKKSEGLSQGQRFINSARQLGVDEDMDIDDMLRRLAGQKPGRRPSSAGSRRPKKKPTQSGE